MLKQHLHIPVLVQMHKSGEWRRNRRVLAGSPAAIELLVSSVVKECETVARIRVPPFPADTFTFQRFVNCWCWPNSWGFGSARS